MIDYDGYDGWRVGKSWNIFMAEFLIFLYLKGWFKVLELSGEL